MAKTTQDKKAAEAVAAAENQRRRNVVSCLAEQLEKGESTKGLTPSEIREKLNLKEGQPGFAEVMVTMNVLRAEGVLCNRFHSGVDYIDSDTNDVPNLMKRENAKKIQQPVFFLSQQAIASGDALETCIKDGTDLPESKLMKPQISKSDIANFYEELAAGIDSFSTDAEFIQTAIVMLKALKPVIKE